MTVDNIAEQSRLLSAITGRGGSEGFEQLGLEAYQRNLRANAIRAMEAHFPVVQQLLGEEGFKGLIVEFLGFSLPETGDWGEWGALFPEWLQSHEISQELPYLKDCAQLDWLHHLTGLAADYDLDAESYPLMTTEHAAEGKLALNSTVQILRSDFPVVDIWQAHQEPDSPCEQRLADARAKLQNSQGQTALIWRQHWQVKVRTTNALETFWLDCLVRKKALGEALEQLEKQVFEQADGQDFAFDLWLPEAISTHLVIGFEP